MTKPLLVTFSVALVGAAVGCAPTLGEAQEPAERSPSGGGEGPAAPGGADYVHPVIAEYGRALPIPDAAYQPDSETTYRVVFDVTASPAEPGKVNPGLEKIARFLNLYAAAGVAPERMELVAVLHGGATEAAMSDEGYQARHGRSNPNTPLLGELARAGVELNVCGQALAHQGIERGQVAQPVQVALAALTVTSTLQLRGWAILRF